MGSGDPLITYRRVPEHAGMDRESMEAFAELLRARVTGNRSFHCRITGDSELRRLNRDFLGKDYATDVLSFPSEGEFLGDLAISRHRAAVQAAEFGHTLTEELQILLLHGVLHLLGFDHETDGGEMARVEKGWRSKLGMPTSLIERATAERVNA